MNLQDKIAKVETEIYRTAQVLDWVSENVPDGAVDLDEIRIELGLVSVSPKTVESLEAWSKIATIGAAQHSAGNVGVYTFTVGEGNIGAFVFVRCPLFLEWDERRGVKGRFEWDQFPTRTLVDDLTAFHASPVSQEVTT